jgi:hypothetical protein
MSRENVSSLHRIDREVAFGLHSSISTIHYNMNFRSLCTNYLSEEGFGVPCFGAHNKTHTIITDSILLWIYRTEIQ